MDPTLLRDFLKQRIDSAAREVRRLLVSVSTATGYVLVSLPTSGSSVKLPLLGVAVDKDAFVGISAWVILTLYVVQQLYYQDLLDSVDRFKRLVGNPDEGFSRLSLPTNRILAPSLVVFASFGQSKLTRLVSWGCNRVLGVLGLLAFVALAVETKALIATALAAALGIWWCCRLALQHRDLVRDREAAGARPGAVRHGVGEAIASPRVASAPELGS